MWTQSRKSVPGYSGQRKHGLRQPAGIFLEYEGKIRFLSAFLKKQERER